MDPAGDLTLDDLILALGERHGLVRFESGSDNRAKPITDPATRDRLTRAINTARREIYSRMPDAFCFQPRMQITCDPAGASPLAIDADPAKYALPRYVQGLAGGRWTWTLNDSAGHGREMMQVHPSDIAGMHYTANSGQTTGFPTHLAYVMERVAAAAEPGRKVAHHIWIYPKPDKAYILEGQVRVMFAPLTAGNDLEPMGQQHIETILAFAERAFRFNQCEPAEWATIEANCDRAMTISINLDNNQRAQTVGVGYDPDSAVEARRYSHGRYYPERAAMVDTVSGIPVL